jgi:hypothetical protein
LKLRWCCAAEQFSNAVPHNAIHENLGGKLVGVQTAGGVISTGAVQTMDVERCECHSAAGSRLDGGLWNSTVHAAPCAVAKTRRNRQQDRQLNKAIKGASKKSNLPDAKETPCQN